MKNNKILEKVKKNKTYVMPFVKSTASNIQAEDVNFASSSENLVDIFTLFILSVKILVFSIHDNNSLINPFSSYCIFY